MHYTVAAAVDTPQAWGDLQAGLPEMLEKLRASDAYSRVSRPPHTQRGVYLFSEHGRDLYVGRTGITARRRRAGTPPSTSFRARFDQHTQAGRPPGTAPFAMRLAREAAEERRIDVPINWWKNRDENPDLLSLFLSAKERIAETMEMRVVAFDDDVLGIRSTIAEIYVHAMLLTPYNDFSPS